MRKLTVITHVTLDGVMQAPARPDEDTRGGFGRGGWAQAGNDQVMADFMGVGRDGDPAALLLRRRTYLDFFGFWPHQPDNPYTDSLTKQQKYVASRTLAADGAADWPAPGPASSPIPGRAPAPSPAPAGPATPATPAETSSRYSSTPPGRNASFSLSSAST